MRCGRISQLLSNSRIPLAFLLRRARQFCSKHILYYITISLYFPLFLYSCLYQALVDTNFSHQSSFANKTLISCGVGLSIIVHIPPFDAKKHMVYILLFPCAFTLFLILINYFTDYANCIISASSSLNSSKDNDRTHSAISSRVISPFFINLSAVSLSAPCLSLLINDFILHQTNST